MKFYRFKYFEDENQENPSIQEFREGYNTDSENSATHIWYYKRIDLTPDLDFVLEPYGKATDLLHPHSISSHFVLVSPRFFDVLRSMNLLNFQRFDAIVRRGAELLPYHFMNFTFRFDCDENNLVDFSKTRFFSKETPFPLSIMAGPSITEGLFGEFQTRSWEEFYSIRKIKVNDDVHKIIRPLNKLYVTNKEFLELDLFYDEFGNFTPRGNFIISERLAEIIAKEEFTGMKVSQLEYEIELSV